MLTANFKDTYSKESAKNNKEIKMKKIELSRNYKKPSYFWT
jgi:hypothetical protein